MTNWIDVPFLNPIKFYPTGPGGVHFDQDWDYNRILDFQTKARYYYKHQRGDTLKIQVKATLLPAPIQVYNCHQQLQETEFPFTLAASGGTMGYSVYETA